MNLTPGQEALAAYQNGDIPQTRQILLNAGDLLTGDTLGLQILALTAGDPVEEDVLLQHAAYEAITGSAEPFFNLAVLEQQKGNLDRALLLYQQAIHIDPEHLGALNNASDLLRRRGRSVEAWDLLTRYLAAGGVADGLEIRLAKVADDCGHTDEARQWFKKALEREPGNKGFVWERAMQQLRDEEFEQGWAGYETRKDLYDHSALGIVSYSAPYWNGQSLKRKSLLVHKEQGLGDTIMFASFLSALSGKARKLHVAVQPPLARLFAVNFPSANIWSSASAPEFDTEEFQHWRKLAEPIDYQLPFGSLPFALESYQIDNPTPYLHAFPADQEAWMRRLQLLAPGSQDKLRAGLVITARRDGSTGPGIAEGLPKSVPARLLRPLDLAGVAWFGLHDRATCDDLAHVPLSNLTDTSPWLLDMCDTAALIANLDVVVAVDTAVAHLAGAMGKKVLLMLRCLADWRWGRNRRDSYWYPDIEVFRQNTEGDWSTVIDQVAERLSEIAIDASQPARR